MLVTSNNPTDCSTAEALLGKIQAETTAARSVTARNWAISAGITGGVIGLTAAACLLAWGQRNPSPEAWQAALDKMPPVKVEVSLDPKTKVALADGSEVTLKDGGEVKLADGAEVALQDDVSVRLDTSSIKLPDMSTANTRTGDGTAIKREVVVFNAAPAGPNRTVMTGWRFANGNAKSPTSTYCYLDIATKDGGDRIDLAVDRVPAPGVHTRLAEADTLLGKCTWWSGTL